VPFSTLLSLSSLIFFPNCPGVLDVFLLTFFYATAKQDDESISILAKIDAISGAEIYPAFENACADTFGIGQIALLHAHQGSYNFGSSRRIQAIKPFGVGLPPSRSIYSRISVIFSKSNTSVTINQGNNRPYFGLTAPGSGRQFYDHHLYPAGISFPVAFKGKIFGAFHEDLTLWPLAAWPGRTKLNY
jgi:hypothetical protein